MALPLTIDTHAHYFPESYLKLIAERGQRCGEPERGEAGFRDHFFRLSVLCISPAICGGM